MASPTSRSVPAPLTSAPTRTRAGSTSSAATPCRPRRPGSGAAPRRPVLVLVRRRSSPSPSVARRAGVRPGRRAVPCRPPPRGGHRGGQPGGDLAGRTAALAGGEPCAGAARAPVRLRGRLRAFADPAGCQRRQAVHIERRAPVSGASEHRFPDDEHGRGVLADVRPAGTAPTARASTAPRHASRRRRRPRGSSLQSAHDGLDTASIGGEGRIVRMEATRRRTQRRLWHRLTLLACRAVVLSRRSRPSPRRRPSSASEPRRRPATARQAWRLIDYTIRTTATRRRRSW